MPRFANNSATFSPSSSANNRNGQVKFHWSFSYEYDLPKGAAAAANQGSALYARSHVDELGFLLDKALAFAG